MVVRELIALLGVKPDKAAFKKSETMMGSLGEVAKKLAITVGGIFAASQIWSGLKAAISNASAVNETLNVLDASFKENQNAVIAWAESFAQAAGRSQYDMREMAATLGAVLNPMMEGNAKVAAEMSTRLSELVVDLGSFFNAAEPDVLMALRSGISGEAEPLKRFGIVMNEATLKEYAMRAGINKSIKSMTNAEKTTLRYNFILEQTKAAHGDAAKTAGGFANASKALMARLKDAGTSIGLRLLPSLEEGIALLIGSADSFQAFADVIGRSIGVVVKVIVQIAKFLSNLGPLPKTILKVTAALLGFIQLLRMGAFGKWVIVLTLIALLLEDISVWLEGGNSVLGKFLAKIKEWTGIDFDPILRQFADALNILAADPEPFDWGMFFEEMVKVTTDYFEMAAQTWSEWWASIKDLGNSFYDWYENLFVNNIVSDYLGATLNLITGWAASAGEVIAAFAGLLVNMWNDPKAAFRDFIKVFSDNLSILWENVKSVFGSIFNIFDKGWGYIKKFGGFLGIVESPEAKGLRVAGAKGAAGVGGVAPGGRGATNYMNAPKTTVQIDIKAAPGMSEEGVGKAAAAEIGKILDKQNRDAMKSLAPQKAVGL